MTLFKAFKLVLNTFFCPPYLHQFKLEVVENDTATLSIVRERLKKGDICVSGGDFTAGFRQP